MARLLPSPPFYCKTQSILSITAGRRPAAGDGARRFSPACTNRSRGYNGRGVAMANLMVRVLAERAMGKPPAEAVFPTTSLKNYPFSRLKFPGVPPAMCWMCLAGPPGNPPPAGFFRPPRRANKRLTSAAGRFYVDSPLTLHWRTHS